MSFNEYLVNRAVTAGTSDLADERVFSVGPEAWDELQELLDRPPTPIPEIGALLAEVSTLDRG